MNRLVRNFIFSVKNSYNSRTIASFVRPQTIQHHEPADNQKKLQPQWILDAKSNQCSLFAVHKCQRSSYSSLSQLDYEKYCAETLEDLSDYIEELIESTSELATADAVNEDGVLTVSLGPKHGTYVINKQSPNQQIWLSSPISGPKRFDFTWAEDGISTGYWVYKHSGETLHELLDKEFTEITKSKTHFNRLSYGLRR